MPTTTPTQHQAREAGRTNSDLERRYGAIGIPAVAAAARFTDAAEGKHKVAKTPVLDPRFEEAAA